MKQKTRILMWVVGLGLLGLMVHQVGLGTLWSDVSYVGWKIVPIVLIALTWHVSNTWAWWVCFDADGRPSIWRLFRTKLGGEAVGNVTPAATVGGEVAKVYMLRTHVGLTRGVPSLVVNKTIEVGSGLIFALTGTIASFYVFPVPQEVQTGLSIALAVTSVAIALLIYRQRRNTFGWILGLTSRLGFTFLEKRREQIEETDRNIAAFYRHNRTGFVWCTVFHILSWILGVYEIYYILDALGSPVSFLEAYLLGSLNLIINTAFFFVPSGVGVFEGGHVFLFHLLGLDAGLGLAVGILRRIRKIFWVIAGFALMVPGRRRTPHKGSADAALPPAD